MGPRYRDVSKESGYHRKDGRLAYVCKPVLDELGHPLSPNRPPDAAKPLLARAYLIFAQLGSPHEQAAVNALVHAFDGDVDAVNVYLAQVAEEMQANDESSKT